MCDRMPAAVFLIRTIVAAIGLLAVTVGQVPDGSPSSRLAATLSDAGSLVAETSLRPQTTGISNRGFGQSDLLVDALVSPASQAGGDDGAVQLPAKPARLGTPRSTEPYWIASLRHETADTHPPEKPPRIV